LNNLQTSLTLESQNRTASIQALQTWLAEEVHKKIEERAIPIDNRLNETNERINALTARVTKLEEEHKDDREKFPAMIDQRCSELLQEIRQFRATFEQEQLAREEKDKRILVQIRDQGNRLRGQFKANKDMSEAKMSEIRQELQSEILTRAKGSELLQKTMSEEVARIELGLEQEMKEREEADNTLVQAVSHYTAALQDGLKIVSAT
jgi:hypothetical protein